MRKVLIADDSYFIRKILRDMLVKNGFNVIGEAENGFEVVKKYVTLKPDIVTLDIVMPEKNGIKVLQEIIALDANAKIVIMTATGHGELVKEAISNGAKDFIIMPFKEDMVIQRLNNL